MVHRPPLQPDMNNGALSPFPSLAALRAEHNTLLRAHQEQGDVQPLVEQITAFLRQGQATGVLLDAEPERWTTQSLLDYWTATLLSAGEQPPDALLADFDPNLAPELPDELCPYVGLDAFREETSSVFFGRQRLSQLLLDRLQSSRFLAVVGPSGSGKSSLVLAGLLPALKRGAIPAQEGAPGSEEWRYAPRIVPGSDPLANLARALQSAGEKGEGAVKSRQWLAEQAGRLRSSKHHLTEIVNGTGHAPTVIVVDQFEELFTLCTDETARVAFAKNLLQLSQEPGHRHTVILTMRTDFETFILRLPGFQPFFEQALVRVTPLNAAELREAIERPAEAVGLKFEAGVVEALLQDILGEPAALPLLQFTLLKLWEHRDRNRITWDAYGRLGGGRLALARSADELYDSLIPEEQYTARRILLRLVRPGDGLEVTSSRIRRDALYQAGEARDRVDRVLQKLINARLLRLTEGDTPADRQVEVAHEALVRNWPRLVEWLDEERERIRERVRLTEAAEQWEEIGRDAGALLRGALLEAARRYNDLNQTEAAFVQASDAARRAEEEAQEAARRRELDQVRALAEEQRQRAETERRWGEYQAQIANRLRTRALLLTVISVVAALLATATGYTSWAAWRNLDEARIQRGVAEAAGEQEISARRTAIAERDQSLSIQATLAGNLEVLLAAQVSADATIAALESQLAVAAANDEPDELDEDDDETPTPTATLPPGTPTPTPEGTPTPAGIVITPVSPDLIVTDNDAYAQARIEALQHIGAFRSLEATATALPAPIAQIVETAAGSTSATVQGNLVFRVEAYDPLAGQTDGSGIEFVELQILDEAGASVHARTERNAGYCAFGDRESSCITWSFAENNYLWPSGQPIQPGAYLLRAIAYSANGTRTQVELPIQIVL
jgi:energy-coupling factor transporter ATP-binding protein EcfA2